MRVFATVTTAPAAKTDTSTQIAILYAGLLVLMSVAQLFTFEGFIGLVQDYNLPLPGALPSLIAPLLVAAEVLAIPFLLRMRLSTAFRWLSMFLGWLVAGLWLFITIWVVYSGQPVSTVGFLGTIGDLTPGIWSVFFSAALAVLAAWASWGMWPQKPNPKTSRRSKK